MAIQLTIPGRAPVELTVERILFGSEKGCTVLLSAGMNIAPKHAVIHRIDGRWQIETFESVMVYVGDTTVDARHPLCTGDVVRLTEHGPYVKFEHLANGCSLSISKVPPPTGSDPLIPIMEAPSSTSIQISKSPSSATIRTTKPPSSTTIRASRNGAIDSDPTANSSRSSSGSKIGGSSSQMPVYLPPMDDEVADVPALERISSWDDADDAPEPRRRSTDEKAEIQWIMMVVGRSVALGLVLLIVWIAISSTWMALSAPQMNPPPSSLTNNRPALHLFATRSNSVAGAGQTTDSSPRIERPGTTGSAEQASTGTT